MKRIGISPCFLQNGISKAVFNNRPVSFSENSLLSYVKKQGGWPVILPPFCDEKFYSLLEKAIDGLILPGGTDIHPKFYNEEIKHKEWVIDPNRDELDFLLCKIALTKKIPILGICRGLQIINIYHGGSLYQDIYSDLETKTNHRDANLYEKNEHEMLICENSLLSELSSKKEGTINSVHHQAIKTLGKNLIVESTSKEDGIIESIRLNRKDAGYCFGVQWHPERCSPGNEFDNSIGKSFINAIIFK